MAVGSVVARGMWNLAAQWSAFWIGLKVLAELFDRKSKIPLGVFFFRINLGSYLFGNVANGRGGKQVAQHRQRWEVNDLGHLAGAQDAHTKSVVCHGMITTD